MGKTLSLCRLLFFKKEANSIEGYELLECEER